jgi:hypothetical protein
MDFPPYQGLVRDPLPFLSSGGASSPLVVQDGPPGLFLLYSACGREDPLRRSCHTSPAPTHSVSTLSASWPEGRLFLLPGLFRPGTLVSFILQGFFPLRDPEAVSSSVLPCRYEGSTKAGPTLDFEGLLPLKVGLSMRLFPPAPNSQPSWLLLFPSEAFPFDVPKADLTRLLSPTPFSPFEKPWLH